MKANLFAFIIVTAIVAHASATEIIITPVLNIDYNVSASTTQPGFQAFNSADLPSKSFGSLTVSHTNQQDTFNRGTLSNGGGFTYANLYNDFVYSNIGNFQVKISGLSVSSSYELRLYVYDNDDSSVIVTNTFTPIAGTLGAAGVVVYTNGVAPTTNTQYSTLVDWTSNSSGEIQFDVSANYNRRFSAFELFQVQFVPEPSTFALLGLGTIGLAIRARRRRRALA